MLSVLHETATGAAHDGDPVPVGESGTSHAALGIQTRVEVSERPAALSAPSSEFLSLIPHEYARRHLILSAGCHSGVEHVLVADRTSPTAILNVGVRLKRAVRATTSASETIASAIDIAYANAGSGERVTRTDSASAVVIDGSSDVESELAVSVREAERDLLNLDGKAPCVRLVDLILFEALQRGASDIHVQPIRNKTLVRFRLDGALRTVRELPGSLASGVVSRVKVMANLDVAERRTPQDGRATVAIGTSAGRNQPQQAVIGAQGTSSVSSVVGAVAPGRRIDLRVSTLPSTYGERLVMRLLDPSRSPHLASFAGLGMPEQVSAQYLKQVARTNGIVLSTGPTGSGKTTTLYATLSWISSSNAGGLSRGCELNMMTVEDPVEYDLSATGLAITQTQVDPKKNVTFVTGLRHILRQDPDVIMVGEIRDQETARIAVQAALTGHLVLSTLHTNDAASAIARLIDLGVEPFLVASSLSAVLAQRLVRCAHRACLGEGCEVCSGTGFKGRVGVFELLLLDAEIREMIVRRASAMVIKEQAQAKGMVPLREAGAALVASGVTKMSEIARVIESLEDLDA